MSSNKGVGHHHHNHSRTSTNSSSNQLCLARIFEEISFLCGIFIETFIYTGVLLDWDANVEVELISIYIDSLVHFQKLVDLAGQKSTSWWLLDFDACSSITMDQAGIQKACKAFIETDAYCSRPHSPDIFAQNLWIAFGNRHIAAWSSVRTFDFSLQILQDIIDKRFFSFQLVLSRAQQSRWIVW